MRVWDIPPQKLCRRHLLGQHNEIHALWTVISEGRTGYAHHPETLRWKGKLPALLSRHDSTSAEMVRRGYNHRSPLGAGELAGERVQLEYVDTVEAQIDILRAKGCECELT